MSDQRKKDWKRYKKLTRKVPKGAKVTKEKFFASPPKYHEAMRKHLAGPGSIKTESTKSLEQALGGAIKSDVQKRRERLLKRKK